MNIVVAFAALLCAQELDASAGARVETNAGFVPVPGGTNTATLSIVAMEATPTVSGFITTRSTRFTLSYAPRIYYRISDEENFDPLLLNRVTMSLSHAIDRDLGFDFSLTGSRGELDYAIATTGTELGVAQEASIITITSLIGSAGLTKRFAPSETLDIELRPSFIKPETSSVAATTQLRVGADVTYTRAFTSRDQLQLSGGAELITFDAGDAMTATVSTFSGERRIYTARASVRYEHDFSRSFEVHGLVGASTTFDDILPLAELGFDWDIHRRGNWHLTTAFSAGFDTFANPLLGTFDRRLISSFGLTIEYGSRLDVLLTGSFFTTLGEIDVSTVGVTESVFQARLPISYRFDDNFSIEVGVRTSLRGPRLEAENFRLGQPEFVGYASLTASIDTRLPGR